METARQLFVALFPVFIIIGVWGVWFKGISRRSNRSLEILEESLTQMEAQNEKLERIAKALEQKNGTDVK